MIAYILMGLGAYLLYDDWKEAKAKKLLKEGGANETISENGTRGRGGNSNRKPGAASQETDRERSVIGVPAKSKPRIIPGQAPGIPEQAPGIPEQGGNNELFEEPVQHVKLDTPGGGISDDSRGQSDTASSGDQAESVKENKGGQNDAGDQNNLENGISDDGDNVDG